MANIKPRTIIIVSIVISAVILLFVALYGYNTNKDLKAIEDQINTEQTEYEAILAEINSYDVNIDVNDVRADMRAATNAGSKVAKLQTDASKYYREHVGPMDSVWADDYKGDPDTLKEMKQLFPDATDTETVMPWSRWICTWEFSPVFDYQNDHTRLSWTCRDRDDRLVAMAYATYQPKSKSFKDLTIIYTRHGAKDLDSDYDENELQNTEDQTEQEEVEQEGSNEE